MNDKTIEQLRKYKALLDEGVIAQEEYDSIKAQLLAAPEEDNSTVASQPVAPQPMPYVPSGSFNRAKAIPSGARINKKVLIGGIAAVAAVIVLIVVLTGGPNLKSLYKKYCSPTWANVASDGSYLSIDTNPYDEDDKGLAYPEAYEAIKNVNAALGLPETVLSEMESTRSIDGRQEYVYKKVKVSWRYHPDQGLEVTYSKNK